jgi:glycosyltransferase involved in cell wall biosynthesis
MKLPISAIVVGLNEGKLLRSCLPPLTACDEILYFDLGSTDDSIAVARSFGATVIEHPRVACCEEIHASHAHRTKNEWVLITDPDEVISPELMAELASVFATGRLHPGVGAVMAPWIFYFGQRALRGTPWGGLNRRVLLAHHQRFVFTPQVHVGRTLKAGFEYLHLEPTGGKVIHHYWMQGYRQLIAKHRRYLKKEGAARYAQGQRTGARRLLLAPWRAFRQAYLEHAGYRDGLLGLGLSVFWTWYQTAAEFALRRHQAQAAR